MAEKQCENCGHTCKDGEICCPWCGCVHKREVQSSWYLEPGTVLAGRYELARFMAQGGHSITYEGRDLTSDRKIVIREYFPVCIGQVTRNSSIGPKMRWSSAADKSVQSGITSFLQEARRVSALKLMRINGISDCFAENNTGYIVTDFVEGQTLSSYVQQNGPMTFRQTVQALMPILVSMEIAQKAGIVHGNICPENLVAAPDDQLVLLDLGASKSREFLRVDSGTFGRLTKDGFSPMEQYRSSGGIGPWTDVYAMAAVVYYCVTGSILPMSAERFLEDPLSRTEGLTPQQLAALQRALAVGRHERTPDMRTLRRELLGAAM